MKTSEIRIGGQYQYGEEVVTVSEKIQHLTNKSNMQSGVLFTGFKRRQKTFLLSNGKIVKADKLIERDKN